ncbi:MULTISPECIES: hypothetical protein [Kitasatospora]|uniref:hypothetical protein n=1 Tax=Kitasatospora TaxID=2063 RepID=UPI0011D1FD30|nr:MULTISPECIES: hypothetical protein [Kitasatospora]
MGPSWRALADVALAVVVGGVPVVPVVLALLDQNNVRRWAWVFVALALAMVMVAFGPGWTLRAHRRFGRRHRRRQGPG